MTPEQSGAIRGCIEAITKSNPGVEFAAVLVGSVARETSTERSDIDVVFVSKQRLQRPRCAARVHAQLFLADDFRRKLREGDDFASWCVRLGLPIEDTGMWTTIIADPKAAEWPDWKSKIPHATRRLILASDLLKTGDLTAASEEALYAATHTARAILLRAGVFPLSRPEIVEQISLVSHPSLSELLGRLLAEDEDDRFLYRTVRYLKRLLTWLDKVGYAQFATKYAQDATQRLQARRAAVREANN